MNYPDNMQFSDNLNSLDFYSEDRFGKEYRYMSVRSYPRHNKKRIDFHIYLN